MLRSDMMKTKDTATQSPMALASHTGRPAKCVPTHSRPTARMSPMPETITKRVYWKARFFNGSVLCVRAGGPALAGSQILVVRPRTAFRRHPVDDLVGILDVAGLAVDAVGGVDLQALATASIGHGVLHDLVHRRRTETRARVVVLLGAARDADGGVAHLQVHRLVLVVFGRGVVHALQAVARCELAVYVIELGRFVVADLVERIPVGLVLQRPRRQAHR